MILCFKDTFKPLVLAGTKIHTIREDNENRWEEGAKIQFGTDVHTNRYSCFKEGVVTRIQYVFMTYSRGIFEVSIGDSHYCDNYLYWPSIEKLAKNDGFENVYDFQSWFIPLILRNEKGYFAGKIIHWTDFKY